MANAERPGACEQCGRSLPGQQGAGRRRRYCGATCRSAARRQRAAKASPKSDVNAELTSSVRQSIVDNVPGGLDPATGGHDTGASADAGRDLLRRMLADSTAGPLEAIVLAQAIARGAEEELAMTVKQAREAGHTWAEIGQTLGTSRQAAFQRFGRPADPRTGAPMEPALPDAGDRATRLFENLVSGHWAAVCATFNATVAAALDAERLAAAWAQVVGMAGRYEHRDAPSVYQAGDYTLVDVPLYFEAGERVGRVSYDRDGQVAGLFFLPPGLA